MREVAAKRTPAGTERIPIEKASGRVLAKDIFADRDLPALTRSTRDGFAIRSNLQGAKYRVTGEVRAGQLFPGSVGPGEAVEIMTGAPLPAGADAVVMVEHVARQVDGVIEAPPAPAGQFLSLRGEECLAGEVLLRAGKRLNFPQIALLAATGHAEVAVFQRPRVAIVATGDELVGIADKPEPHQIRNSNAYALSAMVERAGGDPEILGVARDQLDDTFAMVDRGLFADLLLLSGGVSAGKYDVVEKALEQAGATFYFDRVAIQPGQPLVFGEARGTFFFGLPGNPGSTMVTFEMFARPVVELLAGQNEEPGPRITGELIQPFHQKSGLTRFIPVVLDEHGRVAVVPCKGSSDIPAFARANAWMVASADRTFWDAGERVPVILLEGGSL